jgi:hypothetical protein
MRTQRLCRTGPVPLRMRDRLQQYLAVSICPERRRPHQRLAHRGWLPFPPLDTRHASSGSACRRRTRGAKAQIHATPSTKLPPASTWNCVSLSVTQRPPMSGHAEAEAAEEGEEGEAQSAVRRAPSASARQSRGALAERKEKRKSTPEEHHLEPRWSNRRGSAPVRKLYLAS